MYHKISLVAALCLNTFYICYVCNEYFKYEVTWEVEILDNVELPTLTLCFGWEESLKWATLTAEDRKNLLGKDSTNETEWDHMVAEQRRIPPFARSYSHFRDTLVTQKLKTTHLFGKTLLLQDIVSELQFLKKDVNTTWATGHTNETTDSLPSFITVNTSFDYLSKCFTIAFHREYRTFDRRSVSRQMREKRFIELLSLPNPAVNHQLGFLELYFQYGNQKLNSIHEPLIISLSKTGRFHRVSFKSYFFEFLPPPYQTQCRDYGEDVSKQECYDQCLSLQTVQSFGKFPSVGYVTESDNFDFITIGEEETTGSNISQKFKEIKNVCKSMCSRRECKLAVLIPSISSITQQYSNSTKISITMSEAPIFREVSQPSMPFITFINTVFLLPVVTWLGISLFSSQ